MILNLAKSILHNIVVVATGFGLARLGRSFDLLAGISTFASLPAKAVGVPLLILGFTLRAWSTFLFYEREMRVISLQPQKALITSGPYRFSRNPLYLGGNVFIFFGAALFLRSQTALFATAAHLPLVDRLIRREERQLERKFGEAWKRYRNQVPRWI
jgi:protein-S-isoprenylcysteine O-methyltransferase Ste14